MSDRRRTRRYTQSAQGSGCRRSVDICRLMSMVSVGLRPPCGLQMTCSSETGGSALARVAHGCCWDFSCRHQFPSHLIQPDVCSVARHGRSTANARSAVRAKRSIKIPSAWPMIVRFSVVFAIAASRQTFVDNWKQRLVNRYYWYYHIFWYTDRCMWRGYGNAVVEG